MTSTENGTTPLLQTNNRHEAIIYRQTLSPYAIYYMPLSDAVMIVRVIHGARDIAALAERGGFA